MKRVVMNKLVLAWVVVALGAVVAALSWVVIASESGVAWCKTEDSSNCVWEDPDTGKLYYNDEDTGKSIYEK